MRLATLRQCPFPNQGPKKSGKITKETLNRFTSCRHGLFFFFLDVFDNISKKGKKSALDLFIDSRWLSRVQDRPHRPISFPTRQNKKSYKYMFLKNFLFTARIHKYATIIMKSITFILNIIILYPFFFPFTVRRSL